jgi:hypothetical protein
MTYNKLTLMPSEAWLPPPPLTVTQTLPPRVSVRSLSSRINRKVMKKENFREIMYAYTAHCRKRDRFRFWFWYCSTEFSFILFLELYICWYKKMYIHIYMQIKTYYRWVSPSVTEEIMYVYVCICICIFTCICICICICICTCICICYVHA